MAGTLIKNEILLRVYIVLGVFVLAAMFILFRAAKISFQQGDELRAYGKNYIREQPVQAERGNILTEGGELLATSLPVFDIAFDPNSRGMTQENFSLNIDSLAAQLADHIDLPFTSGGLRDYLKQKREEALVYNEEPENIAVSLGEYFRKKRADSTQYVTIKRGVSLTEKEQISQYPLFRDGQFRGGFIATPRFIRDRPYNLLARRTIGYIREDITPIGLEGKFDKELSGEERIQVVRLVDPVEELWIPVDGFDAIQLERGNDIITTIDIDLQEVTEKALLRALNHHDADWGTAVVMEVKTGKVRAIANLGRTDNGWWETYNYAIGRSIEPGSVFKLASIMALLEDEFVQLEDSVSLNKGIVKYYDEEMRDSYRHNLDSSTVRTAFEISSNVGISSLITHFYGRSGKEQAFVDRLKDFKLNLPTSVEINGEPRPYIKEAGDNSQNWSGTTLPWMSIGYELELTPLQILNFYNTVANNGIMMKPYLVARIQHHGEVQKEFKPTILSTNIASRKTIAQAQELLEGVVLRGTAKSLRTNNYNFAGKTGTAQVGYQRKGNSTSIKGHQASFAGYFPAEKPIYSCIVVVNKPRQNGIYGAQVAGPVFREIADKAFAFKVNLHDPINDSIAVLASNQLPDMSIGETGDMDFLLNHFQLPHYGKAGSNWTVWKATDSSAIKVMTKRLKPGVVPNVIGLGLRDALYILENAGLKTKVVGVGKVQQQSISPGTSLRGQDITIRLR